MMTVSGIVEKLELINHGVRSISLTDSTGSEHGKKNRHETVGGA